MTDINSRILAWKNANEHPEQASSFIRGAPVGQVGRVTIPDDEVPLFDSMGRPLDLTPDQMREYMIDHSLRGGYPLNWQTNNAVAKEIARRHAALKRTYAQYLKDEYPGRTMDPNPKESWYPNFGLLLDKDGRISLDPHYRGDGEWDAYDAVQAERQVKAPPQAPPQTDAWMTRLNSIPEFKDMDEKTQAALVDKIMADSNLQSIISQPDFRPTDLYRIAMGKTFKTKAAAPVAEKPAAATKDPVDDIVLEPAPGSLMSDDLIWAYPDEVFNGEAILADYNKGKSDKTAETAKPLPSMAEEVKKIKPEDREKLSWKLTPADTGKMVDKKPDESETESSSEEAPVKTRPKPATPSNQKQTTLF